MLNERCTRILTELLHNSMPLQVPYLAGLLKISSRTIRYDLNNVDEFLISNNLPQLIRKPHVGIQFSTDPKYRQGALKLINNKSIYHYPLSPNERKILILSELIQHQDFITINELSESLSISRSTAINDLKGVKSWLEENHLTLRATPKYGIRLEGDEKQLRQAFVSQLVEMDDAYEGIGLKRNIMSGDEVFKFNYCLDKLFDNVDINFIENRLMIVEKDLEVTFSDAAFYSLILGLAVSVKRMMIGKYILLTGEDIKAIGLTREFIAVSKMAGMLEENFKIKITLDEMAYMTFQLLGSNLLQTNTDLRENWLDMQILTNKLIEEVGRKIDMDFSGDNKLFQGLLEDLRPAIYRIKSNMTVRNPLLSEIKTDYSNLLEIVKCSLTAAEEFIGKKFTEDEAGYLAMHFIAAIEKKLKLKKNKVNVLIVCGTGIGTARLISAKLESMFDLNIVDSVAYHQVNAAVKKNTNIDFIISTVDMDNSEINYIRVNPLMSQEDIKRVEDAILKIKPQKETNIVLDELVKIINGHCNILNYDDLLIDLRDILKIQEKNNNNSSTQPFLSTLLKETTIELNVEAGNWEEAVRSAGSLLKEDGAIEERYIDAMIDTVKEFGPYIVILPGVAMPHARPDQGVKRTGMSLITLRNPVAFEEGDVEPVKIVIALCSVDHASHLRALSQLSELLDDKSFLTEVIKAQRKKDILNYIMSSKAD